MKTLLLNYPSDWFVTSDALNAAKKTLPVMKKFYENNGVESPEELPFTNLINEVAKDVYSVPVFSDKFCEVLMNEIPNMGFEPNSDEDELRQIPEVVLKEKFPAFHDALMQVVLSVINPLLWTLWNRTIKDGGIQIANYNVRDKKQGAWHHDLTSDVTVVVPLNTGEYSGGGTEFLNRGVVSPQPVGNALVFPSFTHLHRGLPVNYGNRYLLVFWLKGGTYEQD